KHGEDQALERYLGISQNLDRRWAAIQVLVPRGWLIAGLVGLAPAFIMGERSSTALAVGVGGILLAFAAFRTLVEGLDRVTAAAIAWERIKLFWQAAARRVPIGQPGLFASLAQDADSVGKEPESKSYPRVPLLDARDLTFRYGDRLEPILQGTGVRICAGDRLLLE